MRESDYQARLIKKIQERLPGCLVLKNDSSYRQGIPDISILSDAGWGVLEVKTSEDAPEQPNQQYYVDRLNKMSFAAFIYPENEEEVLDALQQSLKPRRASRIPKS